MDYLRKHSFYLIVIFFLSVASSRFYFLDLSNILQWSLSFLITIDQMIFLIPLLWFWTEYRFDHKEYRKIKYFDVVRNHPVRLLIQYLTILCSSLTLLRMTNYPIYIGLLISLILIIIYMPVHKDYLTNANIFHFAKIAWYKKARIYKFIDSGLLLI